MSKIFLISRGEDNTKDFDKSGNTKQTKGEGMKHRRKIWSSKNSVSQPQTRKKRGGQEYASHSPPRSNENEYFEYTSPLNSRKFKLGSTQELTPNRIQTSSFSIIGGIQNSSMSVKRSPKEFRIQRSFRSKNGKTKNRPPLYSNIHHFDIFNTMDQRPGKQASIIDNPKATMKALQSKSENLHQMADKSIAQILTHKQPSPGNMYFTADLEEEFTNRLKESGTKITSRTIKHASKTFEEIISQDVHFGTLLHKIKKAYDTYIRSKCGELQSDNECPSYEELETKIKALEGVLKDKNAIISKLEKDFITMRNEKDKMFLEEKTTKDSIIHDLKGRIDSLNKQVTDIKKENDELKKIVSDYSLDKENDKDVEIQNLIHDNTILNEECIRLRNQCDYLIMKENKLRYFYDTLNSAVYPMQEIYDNTMKNIPTTRFYEFLESQNQAPHPYNYPNGQYMNSEMGHMYNNGQYPPEMPSSKNHSEPEPIKKSEISFSSQDSYEPLPVNEIKIPPKPNNIPTLCFDNLPEYETSSEEDDQDNNVQYQNGYNYIDNFYKNMENNLNMHSKKESNYELSSQGERSSSAYPKKSLMYSKSNHRSSSIDFKMSESF